MQRSLLSDLHKKGKFDKLRTPEKSEPILSQESLSPSPSPAKILFVGSDEEGVATPKGAKSKDPLAWKEEDTSPLQSFLFGGRREGAIGDPSIKDLWEEEPLFGKSHCKSEKVVIDESQGFGDDMGFGESQGFGDDSQGFPEAPLSSGKLPFKRKQSFLSDSDGTPIKDPEHTRMG